MNELPDGWMDKDSFKFLPFHTLHNFILRNEFEKYSAHCLTLDMLNSNKDTLWNKNLIEWKMKDKRMKLEYQIKNCRKLMLNNKKF